MIPEPHCVWGAPLGVELESAAFQHAVNTEDKLAGARAWARKRGKGLGEEAEDGENR